MEVSWRCVGLALLVFTNNVGSLNSVTWQQNVCTGASFEVFTGINMYWYTDTDNLVQILPAHAAPDTQNRILNICVLSRVTTLPMWSNLWDVWCPSVSFSTDWQSDYLYVCVCRCLCVSTTVLLVSGFRDEAVCRNGPSAASLAGMTPAGQRPLPHET